MLSKQCALEVKLAGLLCMFKIHHSFLDCFHDYSCKMLKTKTAAALCRKCLACVLEFSKGMKLKHQTLYLYAVYENAV